MEKPFLFLDTSFKSYCCYVARTKFNENLEIKKIRWDNAILRIKKLCPTFSEGNYVSIDTPIARLEFIGLGKIIKMLPDIDKNKLNKCFFDANELMVNRTPHSTDIETEIINYIDIKIKKAYEEIVNLWTVTLDIQIIIKKAEMKLLEYPCHDHASAIRYDLLQWINQLKKHGKCCNEFKSLEYDLAWHSLVQHGCSGVIDKVLNKLIGQSGENYIAKRLLAYYLQLKKKKSNFSGSILLSKISHSMPFENNSELLDPNLVEYACMGYFYNESLPLRRVIVICCEKNQEDRIIRHVEGVKKVNEILGEQALSFYPGYLLYLDQNDASQDRVFDIQKYI